MPPQNWKTRSQLLETVGNCGIWPTQSFFFFFANFTTTQSARPWKKLDSLTITVSTNYRCLRAGVRRTEGALQAADSIPRLSSRHSSQCLVALVMETHQPYRGITWGGEVGFIKCSEQRQSHWTSWGEESEGQTSLECTDVIVFKVDFIISQIYLTMLKAQTDENISEKVRISFLRRV